MSVEYFNVCDSCGKRATREESLGWRLLTQPTRMTCRDCFLKEQKETGSMTDPEKVEVVPPASPSAAEKISQFVIEHDPRLNLWRSRTDGQMPVMPLISVLIVEAIKLAAQQIQAQQRQEQEEKIREARRKGQLLMPDGTPYQPPRPPY